MRKLLVWMLALGFLLLPSIVLAAETVPRQGRFFPQPGDRKFHGDVWVTGNFYRGTGQTDWVEWYPAIYYCASDTTNLAVTRVAQFDWALQRRATGAETINIICNLNAPTRTTAGAGYRLTAVDIVYQVRDTALTSQTFGGIKSVSYSNNATQSIFSWGGTITGVSLTVQTHAHATVTTATLGTPSYLDGTDAGVIVEWQAVLQNESLYRVFGVALKFTRAD